MPKAVEYQHSEVKFKASLARHRLASLARRSKVTQASLEEDGDSKAT